MQTPLREISEKLKASGWVKETELSYCGESPLYQPWSKYLGPEWLPRPTADDIAEEVSYLNLHSYYAQNIGSPTLHPNCFAEWLYTTMRSADALAEVWIAVKGKEKV